MFSHKVTKEQGLERTKMSDRNENQERKGSSEVKILVCALVVLVLLCVLIAVLHRRLRSRRGRGLSGLEKAMEIYGTDYVSDPDLNPNMPLTEYEDRSRPAGANCRVSKTPADLNYWLVNMVWHHRFTNEEISAAAGLAISKVDAAKRRFSIRAVNRPKRRAGARILVKPYPGGRHPRIGFLEGAVDPQRETKFSVFTPWDVNSYVVVDVPEAIWSNLGLTYLAHTHIDTIWTKQGIELDKLEWNRHEDGRLDIERKLPNGIAFGVKVEPTKDAVLMEMWLRNGTDEKLSDLRIQNCVMPKMAKGFDQQANENKVLTNPYVACKSTDGKRWVITAWEGCHRPWANDKCPCFHSDPKFPDLDPGQKETLKGWLSFYEGQDIEAEFKRIEATHWRQE